jgi:Sulfotransferase family
MDMINSGLEATPWGLTGYGFDRYSNSSPNSVSALAENWIQSTAVTLNFEKANPDICVRVYYEQLARDPEGVMNSVFDFLGVDTVPGIANSALANRSTGKYEIGDHKIRTSSQITTASVGTGIRVPSHLMPSGQRKVMNQFLSITPPEPFATSNRQAGSTTPAADHAQKTAGSYDPRNTIYVNRTGQ